MPDFCNMYLPLAFDWLKRLVVRGLVKLPGKFRRKAEAEVEVEIEIEDKAEAEEYFKSIVGLKLLIIRLL